jgi:hypothetical protein
MFSRCVPHGALGQAEAPRNLGVGVPVRHQPQQVNLPRGELGDRGAAAFGVEEGQIADDTRNKRADEFGVRQLELYRNAEGGSIACSKAPTKRPSAATTPP